MIRGCEKKIIFIKDTGCDFFEEAYFVINPNHEGSSKKDIIKEATNIANGAFRYDMRSNRRGNKFKSIMLSAIGFLTGVAVTLGLYLLLL